jgi:hypothetical protein
MPETFFDIIRFLLPPVPKSRIWNSGLFTDNWFCFHLCTYEESEVNFSFVLNVLPMSWLLTLCFIYVVAKWPSHQLKLIKDFYSNPAIPTFDIKVFFWGNIKLLCKIDLLGLFCFYICFVEK